jgi:hypothetical protein
MLKSLHYKNVLFLLIIINIYCQENNQRMETIFYQNDLNTPLSLSITPVKIKAAEEKIFLEDYIPGEDQGNYLTQYLNPERNSRLNSVFPDKALWEIKWRSEINSDEIPGYILLANERIIIQNQSGWELFDISGKRIAEGIRAEGEIFINKKENIFYINDPTGFIEAIDLTTGSTRYYFHPYFGKDFSKSVIFSNGGKIICVSHELPIITHDTPDEFPEKTLFEVIELGNSRETDEDKILNSTFQLNNLFCKASNFITAMHDSIIVLAVPNHIYFIDSKLQITKDLYENFIPLEMSVDEDMRIYLLAEIIEKDEIIKTALWIIDSTGNLISETEIESLQEGYLTPPVVNYEHNSFIKYEDKIIAIEPGGTILWEENVLKPFAGFNAAQNYLLTSEGNILTAFNKKGERKFIYKFENEELTTAPILTHNNEILVTTGNFLYCLKIKDN